MHLDRNHHGSHAGKVEAPSKPSLLRFSELSASRQALIRLCQITNYGQIQNLEIRYCEPALTPPPSVLVEIKLDGQEKARPESALPDFVLREEVCRLLARFDQLGNGFIDRIEVRGGIPRRVVFKTPLHAWR
jgi:hypothetical protein